jgi:predicted nuclease of restriction endonuclease-like (RecB) superfamily
MANESFINTDYKNFVEEVKEKIRQSQYQALMQVNQSLIQLYWDLGRMITEKQEQHKWGKAVVENLSKDLREEFPGIQGFSTPNLWRMRRFYIEYQSNTKLSPLVREISWSNNVVIMEQSKDDLEREFYIQMTKRYGWSKNILIHHLDQKSYQQYLMNQTNFDKTIPEEYRNQAKLAIKDEYNFDFLEIADQHKEKELEHAIMKNIRKFLMEMGGDYTFIANQYRVDLGGREYYIDLLLFHRRLRSLVAIDLKGGEFEPDHAGKMQFYLSVLDEKVKMTEENSSIGIIVCRKKSRTIVEYTLKNVSSPIGVASYKTTEELPEDMKDYLPGPMEILEKLSVFIEKTNDQEEEKKE